MQPEFYSLTQAEIIFCLPFLSTIWKMSFGRGSSPCGRYAEHPKERERLDEASHLGLEQAIPLHQLMDNLRTKISLKERYNGVLKDELEETREGASSIIKDLLLHTLEMRHALVGAVHSERLALHNALRTHRTFQLALTSKNPEFAIGWLDDKLFDNAKVLNVLIDRLISKRRLLHHSEEIVNGMEKWPRPGTLPWERAVHAKMDKLELATSSICVRLETGKILNRKYVEIKEKLRDEQELYGPLIKNLESQLAYQTEELRTLQAMLNDAQFFQGDAAFSLQCTEKEASENRKKRRLQMARIKRAVEKVLEQNVESSKQERKTVEKHGGTEEDNRTGSVDQLSPSRNALAERLKVKKLEIEKLEAWVSRLVTTMRVPDLTHIPSRLQRVIGLGEALTLERDSKEKLVRLLVSQRDELLLILNNLRYTGASASANFEGVMGELFTRESHVRGEVERVRQSSDALGNTANEICLGMLALLVPLNNERKWGERVGGKPDQLLLLFPSILEKIRGLVSSIHSLRSVLGTRNKEVGGVPRKEYLGGEGLLPQRIPDRLVRVSTTPQQSDISDEEEYDDYKVPSWGEVKGASAKVIHDALLKRGLAES